MSPPTQSLRTGLISCLPAVSSSLLTICPPPGLPPISAEDWSHLVFASCFAVPFDDLPPSRPPPDFGGRSESTPSSPLPSPRNRGEGPGKGGRLRRGRTTEPRETR